MGKVPGHRQVTLYVETMLYEQTRCAAYFLGEDIYDFVNEALGEAIERRLTKAQHKEIASTAEHNVKHSKRQRRKR